MGNVTEKPAKAPTIKAPTIKALAGARAFPPLAVVMFHFSEGHHYSGWRPFDFLAARGYLWVEFFFVLSGFILTHAYGARAAELWRLRGYGAFLRARLIRLYPLHLFMLLLILALVIGFRALAQASGYVSIFDLPYHQDTSVKGFVLSLFLVQAWNTMNSLTWNGVSWFVSVEAALCLLFPFLLRLSDGRAWRGFTLIAAGLGGLIALLLTSKHGLDITFHNGVLRGLSDFTIGVGMAVLFRSLQGREFPDWIHSALQLTLLGLLAYAITHTGWSHNRLDIFTVLPIMALVFALAFDKGLVACALKSKLPQKLGEWSYAIYLGQTAWLLSIRLFEQRLYPAPDTLVAGFRFGDVIWWLEPLLLVAVCIVWGGLLAETIETPVAKALRAKRLDASPAPASS
jgi:peptidoglycan/LPS O-acetylase OafA/YrhL